MTNKLMPDALVPTLSVPTVGGGHWDLAAQDPLNFTMIIFYRGLHCPVCKTYLQTLEELVEAYQQSGFSIIAISMDTRDKARESAEEWKLSKTKIGFGLTADSARDWGLYLSSAIKESEIDLFCEPGLFWVRPNGRLYMADVSNMPWPRPDLAYLHSKIPFAVEKKYPARGTHTI